MRLRVSSKSFFEIIKEHRLAFMDFLSDKEYALGLISGFIDAEGYVDKSNLTVCQKDKAILELISEILNQYEIKNSFYASRNSVYPGIVWRLRISTSFKYLPHNSCKVKRAKQRGGEAWSSCRAHNPEIGGSNPPLAI